jgi:WhiB family transcriptional regulator, redox-sensing transcriptional regulator
MNAMDNDRGYLAAMADVVPLKARWTQQDWMAEAVCRGRTALFFPPHGEQAEAREHREARALAVCMTCPVILPCRDYARRHREQGFWGGENDERRLEIRRRSRGPERHLPLAPVAAQA